MDREQFPEHAIHIGRDFKYEASSPLEELGKLMNAVVVDVPYIPSTDIPLGLRFMLTPERHESHLKSSLLAFVNEWLARLDSDLADLPEAAYGQWAELFERHDRGEAPIRQYFERVLLLVAKADVSNARELYLSTQERYKNWLLSQKKERGPRPKDDSCRGGTR